MSAWKSRGDGAVQGFDHSLLRSLRGAPKCELIDRFTWNDRSLLAKVSRTRGRKESTAISVCTTLLHQKTPRTTTKIN
jgi:hypothetical protein